MKRFKFKFQSLLNIEQHKEDVVKQELKALLYNLLKEEKTFLDLKAIYLTQQQELARKQLGLVSPVELRLYESYIFSLCYKIESQQAEVKECEAKVDVLRQKLLELSKRRRMFEKLKERKKKEHDYLLQQSDNKQLDEIAVTRFNHIH